MQLIAVSVSHETAPVHIREKMSFTKRKQAQILEYIKKNIASEAVILSTCNRCEFYLVGDNNVRERFLSYLDTLAESGLQRYLNIYENADAARHLAETAAGLKSMILGEDQILGQVKTAHEEAKALSCCGKYLNTLFRLAVTGAKKVKTDTLMSKTPVSPATISLKLCEQELGTLTGKNVLIIGASGKTGSIVLKNLISVGGANIYATSRSHGGYADKSEGAVIVDYDNRYENLDIYDAVISATSSPHLTLEREEISAAIKTQKKRVFIDLAVPRDIDIAADEYTVYRNIDDLTETARENNTVKLKEADKARAILKEYIDEFCVWKLFEENRDILKTAEKDMTADEKERFRHAVYELKAENDYENFSKFIKSVKEKSYEY